MVNRLREADMSLSDRLHGQENGLGKSLKDYYCGSLKISKESLISSVDLYFKKIIEQINFAKKVDLECLEKIKLDKETFHQILLDERMLEVLQQYCRINNLVFIVVDKPLYSGFFEDWKNDFLNFINSIPVAINNGTLFEISKKFFDEIRKFIGFVDITFLFDVYVSKIKNALKETEQHLFLYSLYKYLKEIYTDVPLFYHLFDGAIAKLESDLIKNKIQVCDPEIVYTRQMAEDAILGCLKSFSKDSHVDKVKMREAMEFLEVDYRKEARDNFEAADMVKNFLLKRYPYVAMLGLLSAISELDDYTNGVFVVCRNAFQIFHGWGRLN